jgi:hypothetical protein
MLRPETITIPTDENALAINKIDLREMETWPTERDAIEQAYRWIVSRTTAPRYLVGFNVGVFDYQFLPQSLRALFSHRVVNLTSVGLIRGEPAKSRDLIARYTSVDRMKGCRESNGHRALADATAAWHTFKAMKQALGLRSWTNYRCLDAQETCRGMDKEALLDEVAKYFDQRSQAKELFLHLNKDGLATLLETLKRR